ncbi:dTDP-4-dehydrorhamnose reductase [Halomonas icarae]|uniref:dTDP-4-dehydrorhamnose reductase n=1 Tax=Halomonas icarae TaxID=2691040 RepID=A0A7X5AL77_9GAMM|nr:dTDP-4-dehydrorhamnose reductase [Halomonas icarae]MDR5903007.1 dTDP-4-dehydrorhamnose reductase [Halomonas icarae]NAW11564.1 dTDP-4-dehydrorhamnose reductase [Halomonas icarae]
MRYFMSNATPRILLLGKNGQVGWELQRSLAPLGELISLDRHGQDDLVGDLTNLEGLRRTVRDLKPDVIVNAAAYTAVDRAEEQRDLATRINAEAPALLAEEARALNGLLVHYSTDYVFDGSGDAPWQETDTPGPVNHYGASKLAGERHIQASGCRHLIFRTSWVYAARGGNFLATMARLMRERDTLQVIDDQIGAPTGAELIADATAHAIPQALNNSDKVGLYHLVAGGETSWHGFATFIAECLQGQGIAIQATPERIAPIPTSEWPTPAARPLNSRLDTTKLERTFELTMPSWQQGAARVLAECEG